MNLTKPDRDWYPLSGPFDPCPPKYVKTYSVPPNQFIPVPADEFTAIFAAGGSEARDAVARAVQSV